MIAFQDEIQGQLASFGSRLQELRLRRKWSLADLATRSGFSRAFLSRLESGGRQASIAAVLTLSKVFGVSLATLFDPAEPRASCVIVRASEAPERVANGLTYLPLTGPGGDFRLQPIRVKVPRTRRGNRHYHHGGEEWLYVLSGSLALSLAGEVHELHPGDTAHFDSRLPHRLVARGRADAEVLLVALPEASAAPLPPRREYRAIPLMNFLEAGTPRKSASSQRRNQPKKQVTKGGN